MKYYTSKEASDIIRKTTKTLRKYISEGKIKAIKSGNTWLIAEEDLKEFLHIEDTKNQ